MQACDPVPIVMVVRLGAPRATGAPLISFVAYSLGHDIIGCYQDSESRAIPTLEGKDSILDGFYSFRTNPIAKCAVAVMRAGYSMFAVQNGGWCAASATAPQTYDKYGKSTACQADGEGGPFANQVYTIKGKAAKNWSNWIMGAY